MSCIATLCTFCYRDEGKVSVSKAENLNCERKKKEVLNRFLKLTERFLGSSFQSRKEIKEWEGDEIVLEACSYCFCEVESFCKLYHEWKRLELEVEWRLNKMRSMMTRSNRDWKRFDAVILNNEKERNLRARVITFRTEFQQKCSQRSSRSLPRVTLERLINPPTKREVEDMGNQVLLETTGQFFLGWVSSLTAVLTLGSWFLESIGTIRDAGEHNQILVSKFDPSTCEDEDVFNENTAFNDEENIEVLLPGQVSSGSKLVTTFSSERKSILSNPLPVTSQPRKRKRHILQPRSSSLLKKHRVVPVPTVKSSTPFRCFCCRRNFNSFHTFQRHRTSFSHVRRKLRNPSGIRTLQKELDGSEVPQREAESSQVHCHTNIGVLRPRPVQRRQSNDNDSGEDNECRDTDTTSDYCNDDGDDEYWASTADSTDDISSSDSDSSTSSTSSFRNDADADSEPQFSCAHCAQKFLNGNARSHHQRNCYRTLTHRPQTSKADTTSNKKVKMESFICNIGSCVQSFNFEGELESHKKLHGSFSCTRCDIVKQYAPDLALHESEHVIKPRNTQPEPNGNYVAEKCDDSKKGNVERHCARCNYSADSRSRYIHHYLKTHLNLPSQRIKCSICGAWLGNREIFGMHLKKSHGGTKLDPESMFKCDQCPAFFVKECQLINHQKSSKNSHPKIKIEKKYGCEVSSSCNQRFGTEGELVAHQRLHGSFSCKVCSAVEDFAPALALHELSHCETEGENGKSGRKICPRCNARMKSQSSYVSHFVWAHLRLRSGTHLCSICKVPLLAAVSKERHFLTHHDVTRVDPEKVRKCTQCPAYFLKRQQLQRHMNMVHNSFQEEMESSGEEESLQVPSHPNKCVNCGKFFGYQRNFQKHMKNCQKKKFVCGQNKCQKSFDFEEELEIHKEYHGNFPCQFCNVVKTYAPNLASHEKIHSKTKTRNDKEKFHCVRCSFKTKDKFGYVSHCLTKHYGLPVQRVMCSICKILLTINSYKCHYKQFHDTKGVDTSSVQNCGKCPAYFLKSSQLSEHNKRAHNPNPFCKTPRFTFPHKQIFCDADTSQVCQQTFETQEDLVNHRKLHGNFKCSLCPVLESYAPKLALHEATHFDNTFVYSSPTLLKRPGHPGQCFKCSRCASTTSGKFKYVTHFLETHLNLPSESVTCQNCGDKFPNSKYLGQHSRKEHDTKEMLETDIAKCDQCPAFFSQQSFLFHHKRRMHLAENDSTTCIDCGRKYATPAALRTHRINIHKKKEVDFQFPCDAPGCKRRFEREIDLGWHKHNIHDNKGASDPLVCHECGKKCVTKSVLKNHSLRLHAKSTALTKKKIPKRYVCEECGKVFKAQVILDIHKLSHSGPASWEHECLFCVKKCFSKDKLMDHIRSHTNEKPYMCEYCGEEYAHGHNLRNHRNRKHNANDFPKKRKVVNGVQKGTETEASNTLEKVK